MARKRSYGTGQLYIENGVWMGRWHTPSGGRPNRRVGPARKKGTSTGLTRTQAEAKLREMMDSDGAQVTTDPGRTVAHVGQLHVAALIGKGRKRSHTETFASHLRVHIGPFFASTPIHRIESTDVERFQVKLAKKGLAPATVAKIVGNLSAIFDYALRKRWIVENPCRLVERPEAPDSDADIRFLTLEELEAVLSSIPDHHPDAKLTWEQVCEVRASAESNCALGRRLGVSDSLISRIRRGLIWTDEEATRNIFAAIDRALILTAALTGMRQGELLALRWRDVDWLAQKARVRRAYVRGEFGTPKSKRSSRGVPLAMRVAGALDGLHRESLYQSDDDLVFGHPHTGNPLDRSQVLKRFKRYCKAAGMREQRFHDLRHTFGTHIAANPRVSLRTLQGWMGHARLQTTEIYADWQPAENEVELVEASFARRTPAAENGTAVHGPIHGPN
jgi:integrase